MAIDVPIEEDYDQELADAWDDIDGHDLDPETVKKARALQMDWYRKMNVHEKGPIEECFEKTKKPPIKVKWDDRNKGDRQHMNVRSRLVAKQIHTGREKGCSQQLSPTVAGDKPKVLLFNDTS